MIKTPPLFSIITVVFNAVSTIENTILSVLQQGFSDYEYIIIDGGSTDGTIDILKKYSGKIKWISEPDKGIYDAMNKGANNAEGRWLFYLGADDIMFDCLEKIAPYFNQENDIFYGDVIFKKTQTRYAGKFNSFKLIHKNIPHQALFYPKNIFKYYKYETSKYKYLADYFLNLQLWSDKRFHFQYFPHLIAEYNDEGVSSLNIDKEFIFDRVKNTIKVMPFYYIPYIFFRFNIPVLKLKINKNGN